MARIARARGYRSRGSRLTRSAASLALAAALAACATSPPDLAKAKQSWQGAAYDDVVLAWGAPARSTTLSDGRKAHTWVNEVNRSRGEFYPSVGIFGGSGNVGVGVGVGTSYPFGRELMRCERTLVFGEGRVAEQTWTGPDEYCETFKKRVSPP